MNRQRWLTLALLASLAINLAILVAALVNQQRQPHVRPPLPDIRWQSDLQLQPQQQTKIEELQRRFRLDSLLLKDDILQKRTEIIEELGNPDYTQERVLQLTTELNNLESESNQKFVTFLLDVSDELSGSQRLALLLKLGRSWFPMHRDREPRNK